MYNERDLMISLKLDGTVMVNGVEHVKWDTSCLTDAETAYGVMHTMDVLLEGTPGYMPDLYTDNHVGGLVLRWYLSRVVKVVAAIDLAL
jgi:hypothetical protein